MSQFVPLAAEDVEIGKVQRCTGTIKWFDVVKRYGFVTLDGLNVDAMLHVSCLQAIKADRVIKDAKVECDVERGQKGWVVKSILKLELAAEEELPPVTSQYVYAKVKWYNQARGFGFVTRGPNTPDVFVHAVTIGTQRLLELRPNQEVLVLVEDGPKGPKVSDIRAI